MLSRYLKTSVRLKPSCRVWGKPVRLVVCLAMICSGSLFAPLIFSVACQFA